MFSVTEIVALLCTVTALSKVVILSANTVCEYRNVVTNTIMEKEKIFKNFVFIID
jgi:hypothetical protein